MTSELTAGRDNDVLTHDELQQVAKVLAQGPVVQQLKRTPGKGKKAELEYVTDVLLKEQEMAKKAKLAQSEAQKPSTVQKQKPKARSPQDKGMEM